MKLIEYTLVDKGMMPTTSGGIDAGYSERWSANIWYWLTDVPDDTPEGEYIDEDTGGRYWHWHWKIRGTRYLVRAFDGMDYHSIMLPVFDDIGCRFHAEKPVVKLTLEQLGF